MKVFSNLFPFNSIHRCQTCRKSTNGLIGSATVTTHMQFKPLNGLLLSESLEEVSSQTIICTVPMKSPSPCSRKKIISCSEAHQRWHFPLVDNFYNESLQWKILTHFIMFLVSKPGRVVISFGSGFYYLMEVSLSMCDWFKYLTLKGPKIAHAI